MSKHLATVARKNCLLTGRNLGTEPGSKVGGHLTRPVGLRERETNKEKEREQDRDMEEEERERQTRTWGQGGSTWVQP